MFTKLRKYQRGYEDNFFWILLHLIEDTKMEVNLQTRISESETELYLYVKAYVGANAGSIGYICKMSSKTIKEKIDLLFQFQVDFSIF